MKAEEIQERCQELVRRGEALASSVGWSQGRRKHWIDTRDIVDGRAFLSSVQNLVRIAAPLDSHFSSQMDAIMAHENLRGDGVPVHSIDAATGLLKSLMDELQRGFLRRAEYYYTATTFDEFLDHAEVYHGSGKVTESSVLVSAVFEDAVRRTADKHEVAQAGVSLEAIIDGLVKVTAITQIKAKRWKAGASIRNKAMHAQWADIDIRDVGELIRVTREIIENL
ncbi:hypothetical protein K7G19_07145 [Cupriavidus sp. DB3]|uniref:hypothetical protein n=1 Tax=Cupriavidus sp. DB3 TaxID=2873259 RepID=UPI001CF2EEBE|nr:hypothetical protein [Cupriavidus sp. DB3]MCA7083374.1 hypothetical protein [Cupriavidus sp. DB3]